MSYLIENKKACEGIIPKTSTDADLILEGLNNYLKRLALRQVEICFQEAETELKNIRIRTKEALLIAKLNGKKLGRTKGRKYITVKEKQYIPIIERYSRDFQGCLTDIEVMKLCDNKISRNTYYSYKRKLKERYCKMVEEEKEDGSTK